MVSQSSSRPNSKEFPLISSDGNEVENRLLIRLPRKECDSLHARMTLVTLALHDPMQEAGQPIEYCYFPNTAMASVLNLMDDGKSIEVGLIGKEGFVGLPLIAGFRTSANRVIAQGPGTAFRIDADSMRQALRSCPQLVVTLIRYSQEFAMELAQIAACNRLHDVNERLARWLLMSRDRHLHRRTSADPGFPFSDAGNAASQRFGGGEHFAESGVYPLRARTRDDCGPYRS